MISAQVIADSKNEFGNRITTMLVTFPRIILAEFNTHRMFSRNSASSRAIPFNKMVEVVKETPFIPLAWQQDHKGMQGAVYITNPNHVKTIEEDWLQARDYAVNQAMRLQNIGQDFDDDFPPVTKQLCNRLLEPFMWHTVIVTATEWENFFALRCPRYDYDGFGARSVKDIVSMVRRNSQLDIPLSTTNNADEIENSSVLDRLKHNKGQAEIHMMALAEAMWDAYNESTPVQLNAGEWHIPFNSSISEEEISKYIIEDNISKGLGEKWETEDYRKKIDICIKIATVMCARVSYTVVGQDQKPLTYKRMVEIHDEMLAANPKHMSPFEHCARIMNKQEYDWSKKTEITTDPFLGEEAYSMNDRGWCGNYRGFVQYRKLIPNENITATTTN